MRSGWWRAAVLAGVSAVSTAWAQSPGYLEITVTALGAGAAALGASGDSRLPVRPSDFSDRLGTLTLHARGARGSVRDVVLEVPASPVGQRTATGDGAVMRFGFASGQTMEPRPGEGWITLTSWDGTRAQGEYEATLVQGRMTLHLNGRFDASTGGPR
ncbi:MAG: hypothetical protein IPN17_35690 [Deltaproteobacteria bacterium]|jgi:hypothetical protein|nr:hypothetical protein [Deltaproteobacteria bacterium]MBP6834573.1 hypothetical protein [Deltaproteobacteria bacterium]